MDKTQTGEFVVCIENTGYPAALEVRKIYEVVADPDAAKLGQIRVIDESGEDYLFPKEFFRSLDLPQDLRAALRQASH